MFEKALFLFDGFDFEAVVEDGVEGVGAGGGGRGVREVAVESDESGVQAILIPN